MTDPMNMSPSVPVAQQQDRSEEPRDWTWSLVFIALTIFLAVTRLSDLDARPFHHDESLFAYYGWLESSGTYDFHDPLLHGPLQIQILGFVFRIGRALGLLGDAFTAARLPAALCGIAIVLPLWGLRRRIGKVGVPIAIALLSVSPAFWFYSRFCRNEMLMAFTTLVLTWTVLRAWRAPQPGGWIVAAWFWAAILACLKENSLFLFFDGATFLVLTSIFGILTARHANRTPHVWLGAASGTVPGFVARSLWRDRYAWIAGLAVALIVLQTSYTNGFDPHWPKSFFGKYAENLDYWKGQHREHRLYGEFHYFLPIMFLYEPFSTLFILLAIARFASRRDRLVSVVAATLLGIGLGISGDAAWTSIARLTAQIAPPAQKGAFLKLFHMTQSWHLGFAMAIGWLTVAGAWQAMRARRLFRAWLVWWTGLSYLQYSYAGEKVPWLGIHILLPMLLLTAELAVSWWRRSHNAFGRQQAFAIVFSAFAFLNAAQGYRLCFLNPTNPGELLVYNHTQPRTKEIGMEMRRLCEKAGDKPVVFLQGKAIWPLIWYIHGFGYADSIGDPGTEWPQMLACDTNCVDLLPKIETQYDLVRVPLRRAWKPEPLHLFASNESEANPIPKQGSDDFALEEIGENPSGNDRKERGRLSEWKALLVYIVTRQPWDAREHALPDEVYVGRLRREEKKDPTPIEFPAIRPSETR